MSKLPCTCSVGHFREDKFFWKNFNFTNEFENWDEKFWQEGQNCILFFERTFCGKLTLLKKTFVVIFGI